MSATKRLFMEQVEEGEYVAHDLVRDARIMACAPREVITHNRECIEEARELLNDALAKVMRDAA